MNPCYLNKRLYQDILYAFFSKASLAASKEISGSLIIFGLAIVGVLIVVLAFRKIRKGLFALA